MMRVSDVIVDFLYKLGIDSVFTVTGGGAMFLNDAVAGHPNVKGVCNHHEQACAMAAVGYSKLKNSFGCAMLTTGCGATNAITGLLDAWQDNVPCIFVSGQVKREQTTHNTKVKLRQFGVQEADIIKIVQSITKYAVMLNDPEDVLFELEKLSFIAENGRPGPVWLDVPLDVQGASVEYENLRRYTIPESKLNKPTPNPHDIEFIEAKLSKAKRPIIIAGNGIRLGNSIDLFRKFIIDFEIPVTFSYLAIDLLPSDDPYYVGRLGIKGDRAGNFALQNADLILCLGCHLSVALTGFEFDLFGREADLIVVDIDEEEHQKNTVKIDHFIHSDIKNFFDSINFKLGKKNWSSWLKSCIKWRDGWPVCLPEYSTSSNLINKYYLIDNLMYHLPSDAVVISDAGSSYYATSQGLKISGNQRYITSGAQADMGFTLPAAIGVCVADPNLSVVGITGDGSFQMNIQELQTIVHNQFSLKIIVLNNNGYLSIRATQKKFFCGREIGTDAESGVSFPSTEKICSAYGISYLFVDLNQNLDIVLRTLFETKGPCVLEVMCPENQEIIPTASSMKLPDGRMISKPLEDMYPFLNRDEFSSNMIVKTIDE